MLQPIGLTLLQNVPTIMLQASKNKSRYCVNSNITTSPSYGTSKVFATGSVTAWVLEVMISRPGDARIMTLARADLFARHVNFADTSAWFRYLLHSWLIGTSARQHQRCFIPHCYLQG